MKKNTLLLIFYFTIHNISAQLTAIPDPVFEQALIDFEIDSDGIINGQIATSDALSVTSLNITSPNDDYIYSLTGIEAFTNLESLTVNVTMI